MTEEDRKRLAEIEARHESVCRIDEIELSAFDVALFGSGAHDDRAWLIAALRASDKERQAYHDALIARHGGEPIALLSELDQARADAAALRDELTNIASADWRKWHEEVRSADDFVTWAQSRARVALAAAERAGFRWEGPGDG